MTAIFKFLLVFHVITGVLGVAAFYAVWLSFLRRKFAAKSLRRRSFAGLALLVLSWLSGGYYYATYYGQAVRAVIKGGKYPWAHTVFMEAKEHIFLFLPFLALAAAVIIAKFGDGLESRPMLQKSLAALCGVLVLLGTIVTLSGAVISGAVR